MNIFNDLFYICEHFSLKILQVFDLILNRGTFQKINLTIPADDFLNDINEIGKEFALELQRLIFLLGNHFQQYISEIITPWGLCHTFNMALNHDSLHLNSTSDDFHYHHIFLQEEYYRERLRPPLIFPKQISTSSQKLWVGFDYAGPLFVIEYAQNDFDGYEVLFHDPHELPSYHSKSLKFSINLRTNILIRPQLNTIDESLYEYEPVEYVINFEY